MIFTLFSSYFVSIYIYIVLYISIVLGTLNGGWGDVNLGLPLEPLASYMYATMLNDIHVGCHNSHSLYCLFSL